MATTHNPAGANRQDFTELFAYLKEAGGLQPLIESLALNIASVRADLAAHYITTEEFAPLEQRVAALESGLTAAETALSDLDARVRALEGG